MDSLFIMPVKVFFTGLILSMIATFTWQSIEIRATHEAAVNAAHSAVADPSHYLTAAQGSASTTLQGAQVQSVQQAAPDVVSSVVSYQPQDTFPAVFSFLGTSDPNKMITMVGTAPGILSTLTLTAPKTMSMNQAITITGSLKDIAGNPLKNQTIIVNVSGGSLSQPIVTTDVSGDYSVTYTSPGIPENVSISATGDGITTTAVIDVKATINFNAMPTTYINQTVTISGSITPNEANQTFTLVASAGSLANGGVITTNGTGQWSTSYTAPSVGETVTFSTTTYNGTGSLTISGPTISFNPSVYNILIGQSTTVQGTEKLGSTAYAGALSVLASGLEGGTYPSTATNSSGNFSFTYTATMTAGIEDFAVDGGGETSTNTATVNVENITTNLTATDDGNGNITLTATVNLPLGGDYTLSILNQTLGTTLVSTTTGTSVSTTVPVSSTQTYSFIAQVT